MNKAQLDDAGVGSQVSMYSVLLRLAPRVTTDAYNVSVVALATCMPGIHSEEVVVDSWMLLVLAGVAMLVVEVIGVQETKKEEAYHENCKTGEREDGFLFLFNAYLEGLE